MKFIVKEIIIPLLGFALIAHLVYRAVIAAIDSTVPIHNIQPLDKKPPPALHSDTMRKPKFAIRCNFCESQYVGLPEDQRRQTPGDAGRMVFAAVSLCPRCVDNPERIRQVQARVARRLNTRVIDVHVTPARLNG